MLRYDLGRWRKHAACRDADPQLFEVANGAGSKLGSDGRPVNPRTAYARKIERALCMCTVCPVRINCLEEALDAQLQGVWGGVVIRQMPTNPHLPRPDDVARARGVLMALRGAAPPAA